MGARKEFSKDRSHVGPMLRNNRVCYYGGHGGCRHGGHGGYEPATAATTTAPTTAPTAIVTLTCSSSRDRPYRRRRALHPA